jgi:hypothetical protein
MPADDLVLNVRQIAGYPPAATAPPTSSLLLQLGGLGGPYASISPADLVSTALAQGGEMAIAGLLQVQAVSGGSANFANATANAFWAQKASIANFNAAVATINCVPIATVDYVSNFTVASFMGRNGAVTLWIDDVIAAGGAPIYNPRFVGCPRADTPGECSNSTRLATTEFVQRNAVLYIQNLLRDYPFVFTFNGRSGIVTLTEQDILEAGGGAVFDNVALTGIPTAPTAPPGTNTTQIATTAFVTAAIATGLGGLSAIYAPIVSPNFSGIPSAPTAQPGTNTAQLATCAFVETAVTDSTTGVVSFNTRTGVVTLQQTDLVAVGGALLASPVFTGNPQAPTAAPGTNNAQLATTAFVTAAIAGGGVLSFNTRVGAVVLTTADITGAGGAPLSSPALTGVPTAPTATAGTSTTQIATTAFVEAGLAGSVSSFNGRSGAVTLSANDISAAGGAPLNSPPLYGTPTAPTAAPGTNTTQLATTAYVEAALAGGSGVASFNGRGGAVVLTAADLTGAGGALLASPIFTGTPAGPTATAGTNTTQLATTAFVTAALGSGFLPLTGGTVTGPLTIGPTANNRSLFDVNGNLRVGGTIAIPSGAGIQGHVFAGAVASQGAGFNIIANAYSNGANWFAQTTGPAMILAMPGGGPFQVLNYPSTAAGAAFPAPTVAMSVTSAGVGTFGSDIATGQALGAGATNTLTIGAGNVAQSQLNFVGSGYGTMTFANTGGRFVIESGATANTTNQWWKYFQSSSGTRFWQSYAGTNLMNLPGSGSLFIAGTLAQGSDGRMKRAITDADDGLEEVLAMTPRRFHRVTRAAPAAHPGWALPDTEELGFIAQEMAEALPIAVAESVNVDDTRSLGIMLTPIVAALVNAVKELNARIATLEGNPA